MFDKKYDAEDLASIYKSVYEKKLDPVGQEDKDIDNDGDHDKSDKYLLNRRKVRSDAIKSGMHRDAKTGEVVDKAEVGKTYYPNMPKKKSSVALRKEKESMKKEQVEEGKASMGADVTDALPWNRNTKYTTQGKLRKPGENVHGQQTGRGLNKTTATMGAKPAPRPLANPGPMKDSSNAELGTKRSHPGAPGGSKGFGWNKLKKEEVELDENRRAARSAGGYKDDSKKQTDPSKDGFTGISGSIKDIMRQNREIEAANKKKTKKEDFELWVHELLEEGYDLSDYTWDEMFDIYIEEGMKQARANVGASTCWDGYKAKGTKKKNGKEVPNCVKEEDFELWVHELLEEGYDLSDYTWDEMFDIYEGERAGIGGNRGLAQGGWRTAARGDETSAIQKKRAAERDKANAAGARGPEMTHAAKFNNMKRSMPTNMRNSYEPEGEDLSEGEWFGGLKKRIQGAADAYNRSRGVPSPQQIRRGQQGGGSKPSITVKQTKSAEKTTPYSKTDSGKLTDFGAGGGKAKMKSTGMGASEVEQLGRANKGTRLPQIDDHSKYHKNSYTPEGEMVEEGKKELSREKRNKMFRRAGNLSREALQGGDKGSEAHKKSGKIVKALNKDAEENNRNDVREETLRDIYEAKKKGLWDNIHAKRKRGESPAKPGDEGYPKTLKVESLEEAAPALLGVLAKMAAKKAAVHVAKKSAEKVKDKMGKLLKGDEEEEG